MAYVALYRAYRPQKFSEVAGQKHIVTTLQNAIKLNKVAHAYLFSGPRGTGKTTMAKIMAKALNCEKGINIEPCCECDICKGIVKGSIPDVIEIDAASNNGVDEIREIRDKVKFLPSIGRYKVYIIDEVHMLSNGAFNALLKTLEEPPSHVVFILATTEPHKIPATILSRCQRFDFQDISEDDIKANLKRVIEHEKINVTDEALDLISEACEGGMRDALSLLDQSISYSTDDVIDVNDTLAVSGNVSSNDIISLINACNLNNQNDILQIISKIISDGKEIPKIVSDIVNFLRDMLMFKSKYGNKHIYQNKDFVTLCISIDNQLIYSWLNELNSVNNNIKFTTQKRAYLELGLLKMSDKKINDYTKLESKVAKLESDIALLLRNKPVAYETKDVQKIEQVEYNLDDYNASEAMDSILVDDSFLNVKMVEEILNNASKATKESVNQALNIGRSSNERLFITMDGTCNASTTSKALFVLSDEARCNRMMKAENYEALLKILNDNNANINSFICIPKDCWDQIFRDYTQKFKAGDKKPELNYIKILVRKYEPSASPSDSKALQDAKALFSGAKIKVKGE